MHSTSVDSWSFLREDDPQAWKKNADESAYRLVTVPHDWAVDEPFDQNCSSGTGYLPGGIGWYRAHVSLAATGLDRAAGARLVFHGVYKHAQVWVNGYHLGGRASGHAEFAFDLDEIVSYAPDDDLVISVKVDHRDLADSRWYNGSGITRRVEVQALAAVSLAHNGTTITTPTVTVDRAEVAIVQQLDNHTDSDQTVTIERTIITSDGSTTVHLDPVEVTVAARGSIDVSAATSIDDPQLWQDDQPALHRLVTTIGEGEFATSEQTFGIRSFGFEPDTGFWINGQHRVLKGVCVHEDAGPWGVSVPPEVWLRRLLALKEIGCNAIRMAHNSHSPELYELCDLLGFYVIDEAFDEWENPKNKWWQGHNVYPPKHEGYAHDYPQWHRADLQALIASHKNHPCVIAWSIGNEVDYPNDPYASPLFEQMTGNNDANKPAAERVYDPNRPDVRRLTTLASELIDIVKEADPTRPVTLAAAFPELSSQTGLLDRLDLIGYNYKEHLYAEDHQRFPHQPFIGSENGHSYQAWKHVVDADYVAGQFLWTGIDFIGETVGWPSHGSEAGLMTTAGFAKERMHLRRSWWTEQPMVRLAVRPTAADPSHEWRLTREWLPETEFELTCASNAAEVSVSQAGQPIDLVFDDDAGYWRGALPAGALDSSEPIIATATVDEISVTDELLPVRPAASLTAQWWTLPQGFSQGLERIARGVDPVHQLECQLRDAAGRPTSGAVLVSVQVAGGELAGIDSGNLSDTSPYRATERATHHGRLLVFVRGAGATVTLRAEGCDEVIVHTPQ